MIIPKRRLLAPILTIFLLVAGTAGFTAPGCSKEDKQAVRNEVIRYAEQAAFDLFVDKLEKKLAGVEDSLPELASYLSDPATIGRYQAYFDEFKKYARRLPGLSLRDVPRVKEATMGMISVYHQFTVCEMRHVPDGEVKTKLLAKVAELEPWVAGAQLVLNRLPGERSSMSVFADACP